MADSNDALIGRIAVHTKLISAEQLADAMQAQLRSGGRERLGEIFVEKGFITPAQLQKLLAAQKQVLAKQAAQRAAQTVAAVVPEPEAGAAAASDRPVAKTPPPPVAAHPSAPAPAAAGEAVPAPAAAAPAQAPQRSAVSAGNPREAIHAILRDAVSAGSSDIHVHAGATLRQRRHGKLEDQGAPLEPERANAMLRSILSPEQMAQLDADGQVDLAYTLAGVARFRANRIASRTGWDGVFRGDPRVGRPPLEELGLPQQPREAHQLPPGHGAVTGPAGCGKSSTLAALLDLVNEERQRPHPHHRGSDRVRARREVLPW